MDPEFWHTRWQNEQIAFHEGEANVLFARHAKTVWPGAAQRLFVPLCGKTRDIAWILSQGWEVVGVELSELAVAALFDELGVVPEVSNEGALQRFAGPGIDVFVGDAFLLTAEMLGPVTGIYDRAALVALPEEMRARYAAHVQAISGGARQLLITFDYDQTQMNGPPFSVPRQMVEAYFAGAYEIALTESVEVASKLKGRAEALEHVWFLTPTP